MQSLSAARGLADRDRYAVTQAKVSPATAAFSDPPDADEVVERTFCGT